MKVLYISTVFPREGAGATIYTDLAEELARRGHQVTVVAAEGKKYRGKTRLVQERGCEVLWVCVGDLYDVGLVKKAISQLTLQNRLISAMRHMLPERSFDVVLFEAPPVTTYRAVEFAKQRFSAHSYLMLKDIFPQNAVDLGMMRAGSVLYRFYRHKEKKLYAAADIIGCMSSANRQYILSHNPEIPADKVEIFPNTKRVGSIPASESRMSTLREKYGIPATAVVFLFGGNMGKAQAPEFLCAAAERLKEELNIFFLFVGRGTEKEKIRRRISSLKNALYLENLPRDEYERLAAECDVGILCLNPCFTIPNYPSRILSYMECALPVVAATDSNTDIPALIEEAECGVCCSSGNLEEFIEKVTILAADAKSRATMGKNGRHYLEKNLCVERSAEQLEQLAQGKGWHKR